MGFEISKRYSYSFHLLLDKLYENISYHRRIQAIIFLGDRPHFTKFMVL